MTRPGIIRADTIDLQDQHSPSAQDHSRQPTHPAPLGIGPAAPHQQSALKQLEHERAEQEQWHSNGQLLSDEPGSDDETTVARNGHDQERDETAILQNGGTSGAQDDGDLADADVDDDLDDDMMDKISSSPSIDDGGFAISSTSLSRLSTPPRKLRTPILSANASPDGGDSSPFLSSPVHLPLGVSLRRRSRNASLENLHSPLSCIPLFSHTHSHGPTDMDLHTAKPRSGEYKWISASDPNLRRSSRDLEPDSETNSLDESRDILTPLVGDRLVQAFNERLDGMDQHSESELRIEDIHDLLLPANDPHLDNSFDSKNQLSPPRPLPEVPKSPTGNSEGWDTDSDDSGVWTDEDEPNDATDIFFSGDPRFVDSGWGGECLREIEDIDFEFVYALHTFVATVEGQANATKGDTMVLLDDSNSYWWLVRVVKDSTIGYLPAEHIETPTERLARLNKHRNIDLAATMLGDNTEKTKNPLKKAMRRRNAKNVSFAPPTYVEASDYDYSSDEDEEDIEKSMLEAADQQQEQQEQTKNIDKEDGNDDDIMVVEPLKLGGTRKESESGVNSQADGDEKAKASLDRRSSDEPESPLDPKGSRNGTMRDMRDSFLKDDTTETRKITLTPKLLMDSESNGQVAARPVEMERGPSLESLEKDKPADKTKEKKKEKKGMLSGLFKRKDKKKGSVDDYGDEKVSEEYSRSSMEPKESMDSSIEKPDLEEKEKEKPSRQLSKGKLQKPQKPAVEASPTKKIISPLTPMSPFRADAPEDLRSRSDSILKASDEPAQQQSSMRIVTAEQDHKLAPQPLTLQTKTKTSPIKEEPGRANEATMLSPTDEVISPVEEITTNPFADSNQAPATRDVTDALSESPVQVSPVDATEPPALVLDNSSQEEPVSPASSPSLIDMPSETTASQEFVREPVSGPPPSRPAPTPKEGGLSPSPTPSGPVWSDASLRSYMDDSTEIRDLLLVVHDKSGVVPVTADHPIMAGLFKEETRKIKELDSSLDSLLGDWLEKKRSRSVASTSR